jgi:hypothetical protein
MGKWVQTKDANWRISATGGWCLQYVRQAFGMPVLQPDATAAWNSNDFPRRTGQPPAGITVPVYFSLGSTPQGHVAIRLDDLKVASSTKAGTQKTGYLHPNIQDLINMYAKYNKGCTYLGWKEGMGTTRFVTYVEDVRLATADEVRQAYRDILERDADQGGIDTYTKKTIEFTRSDLANSQERRTLLANKEKAAAQAQADAVAKAKKEAEAKALADAAEKARIDAEEKAKAAEDALKNTKDAEQDKRLSSIESLLKVISDFLSKIFQGFNK